MLLHKNFSVSGRHSRCHSEAITHTGLGFQHHTTLSLLVEVSLVLSSPQGYQKIPIPRFSSLKPVRPVTMSGPESTLP